jgi:hypothetical protein
MLDSVGRQWWQGPHACDSQLPPQLLRLCARHRHHCHYPQWKHQNHLPLLSLCTTTTMITGTAMTWILLLGAPIRLRNPKLETGYL